MGPLDETVMFRVVPRGITWERRRVHSEARNEVGAVNWLMGRGTGIADAMDGGVWASALAWPGEGPHGWPEKDIAVGPVGALLGPGARALSTTMLCELYGHVSPAEVDAVLQGELRATNVLFSDVPEWYISMNYVLTGEGIRRATPSLVTQLTATHTSRMPGSPAAEFHSIAPDQPVQSETLMFRWLEQVAGMGLTYGLHAVLARDQSRRIWAYPPMFIVAGTAAVSLGKSCFAAVPSVLSDHEWTVLPVFRDAGLLTVREKVLRKFDTPRFLATVRASTSPDGRLVLATSSLLSSPETIIKDSQGLSIGTIGNGPYRWDCTAYSAGMMRIQRLIGVDKGGSGEWLAGATAEAINTYAPGMIAIKRRTQLVYTPPRAAFVSLILDGASTVYAGVLVALTLRSSVTPWGRATFALEIAAEVGSRASALAAWSRSPGRTDGKLAGVATALFAPVHWVLRNAGNDADVDGWLWRNPLRIEAWGGMLSLGPLAAAASLEQATPYQIALLTVISTVAVGSLRFNELWEELVGLLRGPSSGVCASYTLMYICGLLVQSSFLVESGVPWWLATFGVVFGFAESVTAVKSAVSLMRALDAADSGRGGVLRVALSSEGGMLGALTMSGYSHYGDMWDWKILALEEIEGRLVWSPAPVRSVAGGDFRGVRFTEISVDDGDIRLLSAVAERGRVPAATHVLACTYRKPSSEAFVEVMPGVSATAAARSGVDPAFSPLLGMKIGSFYLPIARGEDITLSAADL
eukprot:g2448.t1